MTAGDDQFFWFGVGLIVTFGLVMLIPVWRRRRDALTAWNLLLLGSIQYIGFGCIEAWAINLHWPELKWFTPNSHEKHWFFAGTIVFYASLILFHLKLKFPDRWMQNRLATWPNFSAGTVGLVLLLCMAVGLSPRFVGDVPFIREVAVNLSHTAFAIAVTFATVFWLKNPVSLFALAILIVTFGLAGLESMTAFMGRRLLVTVMFGPLLAVYWLRWRYWPRTKLIAVYTILAAFIFVAGAFYSTFRHFKQNEQRTTAAVIEKFRSVTREDIDSELENIYHYISQYAVHNSLLTIRLVDDGRLEVRPLDVLQHMATYPIPRRLWPEKPRDMGVYIVSEVLGMPYKTTWGMGITGQGYHDGGFAALILYAFLLSCLMRLIDIPLQREPDNPFLLAALASASAHIVAWPRGGFSTMTLNILESLLMVLILSYACRLLFGTAQRRLATPQFAWPAPTYYPPQ